MIPSDGSPEKRKTLADILAESQAEDEAIEAAGRMANNRYTGKPCRVCGRNRVYLRVDGQFICEKCETIQ